MIRQRPLALIVEPATRFELVSSAYETGALPIELRRHFSARCHLELAVCVTKVVGEGIEPSTSGL